MLFALSVVSRPVYADPATAMMVVSIGESLLSLGQKSSPVEVEILLALMAEVEQIHARLGAIEDSLKAIVGMLAAQSKQNRLIIEDQFATERARTVIALAGTLHNYMVRATSGGSDSVSLRNQVDSLLTVLQTERRALMQHSDFIVPVLAGTLIAEIDGRRFTSAYRNKVEISDILTDYDARFAEMQDAKRPDSLAHMLADLESDQERNEGKLAYDLQSMPGHVADGVYPWYSHTLIVNTVEDHLRVWKRQVKKISIEGQPSASLYGIEITALPPQANEPVANRVALRHTEPDVEIERRFNEAELRIIRDEIEPFNERAEDIARLRDLLTLVSEMRTTLAHWNTSTTEEMQPVFEDLARPGFRIQNPTVLRQEREEERTVARVIDRLDAASTAAQAEITNAHNRVDSAIKQAQADGWRKDLLFGLQIFKISLMTAAVLNKAIDSKLADREARTGTGPVQDPTAAQNAPTQPGGTKPDDTNPPSLLETGQGSTPEASTRQHAQSNNSAPQSLSRAERNTGRIAEAAQTNKVPPSTLVRIDEVERIVSNIGEHPADRYTVLPNRLTLEESELVRGMTLLGALDRTEADKFADDWKGREGGIDLPDSLWAFLKLFVGPLAPSVVDDGTREGAAHRDWLRKSLNQRYDEFLTKRLYHTRNPGNERLP